MDTSLSLTIEAMMAEYPRLVSFARRYVGEDAEDAVQETVLKAWLHRSTFDESGGLRNWLYHIARNICIDMLRRKAARPKTVALDDARRAGRDGIADQVAARDLVERAFLAMPAQMRPVLKLWVAGYTQPEIANRLRIPYGSAATRLMRAKRHARKYARQTTGAV